MAEKAWLCDTDKALDEYPFSDTATGAYTDLPHPAIRTTAAKSSWFGDIVQQGHRSATFAASFASMSLQMPQCDVCDADTGTFVRDSKRD